MTARRTAVVDLGSNSFRLVVYDSEPGRYFKRTDEIYEPVRIGEGLEATGELQPEPIDRALHTLELYAAFCRAAGIEDIVCVATSAIREADNRDAFLTEARARAGLDIRVLSHHEEARYGYIAAVNSTTLADGVVFDLGGGSLQLTRVAARREREHGSWPLGAVRMTERFLPDKRVRPKQLKALRAHLHEQLASAHWLEGAAGRLTGLGGTLRNLAAAAQSAAGLPGMGVQGQRITRAQIDAIVDELAALPASERASLTGIKPQRADVILAGTVVVQAVLEAGEFEFVEVTEAGLREGLFLERYLAPEDPPLVPDVRRAGVRNLAAQYGEDTAHAEHVAALALQLFDRTAQAGLHAGKPKERELVWAAGLLHDIGTAIDYDDHHKHSRYLVLNAALPGFSPRERALVAQMTRYHRKGTPALGAFAPLAKPGDGRILERGAAILRIAEQLERSRDQLVREVAVEVTDDGIRLGLTAEGDVAVAQWAAQREAHVLEHAFGRPVSIELAVLR